MSATDELRRLLDERGVRWTACSKDVKDNQTYCYGHTYTEFQSGLMVSDLTPEQAIAATLGRRTCKVEDSIIDTYEYNRWEYALSCGHTIIWESSEPPNYCPRCGAKVVEG